MAEYPNFKHGALGRVTAETMTGANKGHGNQAIVYIGTAPVHQVKDGADNVNKPILVNNIAEARAYFGYSDNWADYSLCEAMHVHFELNGVGPLVLINVLDPAKHQASTGGGVTLTPENGRVKITNAEDAILNTLVVKAGTVTKVMDTDYTATYDSAKKTITLQEITTGALGTGSLSITWAKVDPAAVTQEDVIGATDGHGINTGMYAIENVYNLTGYIPAFILAPGFSSVPAIHNAMYLNSQNISQHWNAWMFVDMPIMDTEANAITLANAPAWKKTNGYNKENESVFFPLVKGTDGRTYHISVLNAANFQTLLIQNNGVPFHTGSNTECSIIEDLYFGESVKGGVYTDAIINRALNANGINSAAFVGGRWVIWGMFSGIYDQEDGTPLNMFDTTTMMLYYLTNDFQVRHGKDSDKPLNANDLKSIVAEEQARVDALLGIGALTYGKVVQEAIDGASGYFYVGSSKLVPSMLILTDAQVNEISIMPGQGDRWVSCEVQLTLKQANQSSGGTAAGGGSGSQKASMKTAPTAKATPTASKELQDKFAEGLNRLKNQIAKAKAGSTDKTDAGFLSYYTSMTKGAAQTGNTAQKVSPTTGRSCEITTKKITLIPKNATPNLTVTR